LRKIGEENSMFFVESQYRRNSLVPAEISQAFYVTKYAK
jgi:hypothetical protein